MKCFEKTKRASLPHDVCRLFVTTHLRWGSSLGEVLPNGSWQHQTCPSQGKTDPEPLTPRAKVANAQRRRRNVNYGFQTTSFRWHICKILCCMVQKKTVREARLSLTSYICCSNHWFSPQPVYLQWRPHDAQVSAPPQKHG